MAVGWPEPDSSRVLCQWLMPALTCLSKVWWPGEVCSLGTHRNTETGRHRYWRGSVWPRRPNDAAAGTARQRPGHCLPKERGAENMGETQCSTGSGWPLGHRMAWILSTSQEFSTLCPPQHRKHELLWLLCFPGVLKGQSSQLFSQCSLRSPCFGHMQASL